MNQHDYHHVHQDYLRRLIKSSQGMEIMFPEHNLTTEVIDQYTQTLGWLFNQLSFNQIIEKAKEEDYLSLICFPILTHLLDLVLSRIEDFYSNYPLEGAYTIIDPRLTHARSHSISEIRPLLTRKALRKFYQETRTYIETNPIEPILSRVRYVDIYHLWYADNHPPPEGPRGAVGPKGYSGRCHRNIITDKYWLSNLKMTTNT